MFWLWVSQIADEAQKISATSVTMKGGMRKRVMEKPLTSPTSAPDREHRRRPRPARRQGWPARRPPASSRSVPQSGLPPSSSLSAAEVIIAAPATLTQPHDGAERQVDSRDDDDEGLPDRHREERPDVGELVGDVARVGERGKEDRHGDEVGERQVRGRSTRTGAAANAAMPSRSRPGAPAGRRATPPLSLVIAPGRPCAGQEPGRRRRAFALTWRRGPGSPRSSRPSRRSSPGRARSPGPA